MRQRVRALQGTLGVQASVFIFASTNFIFDRLCVSVFGVRAMSASCTCSGVCRH